MQVANHAWSRFNSIINHKVKELFTQNKVDALKLQSSNDLFHSQNLRKFEISKFAYDGGFCGLKSSKFYASLRKQQGHKNNPMKTKIGQKKLFHSYTLNSCNKFLEVLFAAF